MTAEQRSATDGYEQLRQRAAAFVDERGGAVIEELLIAHVFGNSGNTALWRPLLRQVLQADDRLVLRSDGYWALPGSLLRATDQMPRDFVVVDVETTGLKPYQARIIEVGLIRFRDGAHQDSFSTLVNPERRLPEYISKLTGIDEAQLAGAPAFRLIADQLSRFLDSYLIIGFNVRFDIAFLNAELNRAGKPSLINPQLDLLPLASQLLSEIRKPGLDGLCRALGIAQRERHRALPDAEATALVFGRMLAIARERGLESFESLQRSASVAVPVPKRRGAVGRGRAVLDRSHLDGIPKDPGVYIMRDAFDRVIYVGKAKNLRNRVASYYSQPLGYTRKMDGLLESIQRIQVVRAGSELEALLLESQFIRRFQPQFNTQQRSSESYSYIKVDLSNPWPKVSLVRQRASDDAEYFGPFRVARAAKATVELVNDVFPLRTCNRSFRDARSYGSPCLELSLGRCLGPCAGVADRDAYRGHVRDALAFLRGDDDGAIQWLHEQLAGSAERLDFERATRLRDRLRRVQQHLVSQHLLRELDERGNAVIVTRSVEPGARELLLVVRGRLWAQLRAGQDDPANDVAYRLARSWARAQASRSDFVDHNSVDQVNIIGRWLRRFAGHPAIFAISEELPAWLDITKRAWNVPDSELNFDRPALPEDDAVDDLDVADDAAVC